ncbi:hypothetical protein GGF42_005265 [Coemansia sp. RSA 2424]|nr:hypothetical protein GGF42_005265 [Coemansia sp. RSA 2424]
MSTFLDNDDFETIDKLQGTFKELMPDANVENLFSDDNMELIIDGKIFLYEQRGDLPPITSVTSLAFRFISTEMHGLNDADDMVDNEDSDSDNDMYNSWVGLQLNGHADNSLESSYCEVYPD